MTMTSDDFEARLAALRNAFARRAVDEADQLEQVAHALPQDGAAEQRSVIREIAHRLSGGAATFGMKELGPSAARLEDEIDAGCSNADIARLTDLLVADIRRIAGESLREAS